MVSRKYDRGCQYLTELLTERDDGKPGFSLKAMRPHTFADDYTSNANWPASDDIYTLRLESKDMINGGLVVISVVSNSPEPCKTEHSPRMPSLTLCAFGVFCIVLCLYCPRDRLPYGAGVWPAFWAVGSEPLDWQSNRPKRTGLGLRNYWPLRGEIDLIVRARMRRRTHPLSPRDDTAVARRNTSTRSQSKKKRKMLGIILRFTSQSFAFRSGLPPAAWAT